MQDTTCFHAIGSRSALALHSGVALPVLDEECEPAMLLLAHKPDNQEDDLPTGRLDEIGS